VVIERAPETGGDMEKRSVPFPDLVQMGTMELPLIALASGLLGGVVFAHSKIAGGIIALPAILWVLYGISVAVSNTWRDGAGRPSSTVVSPAGKPSSGFEPPRSAISCTSEPTADSTSCT
jgi:hypothetical protein